MIQWLCGRQQIFLPTLFYLQSFFVQQWYITNVQREAYPTACHKSLSGVVTVSPFSCSSPPSVCSFCFSLHFFTPAIPSSDTVCPDFPLSALYRVYLSLFSNQPCSHLFLIYNQLRTPHLLACQNDTGGHTQSISVIQVVMM